MTNRHYFNWKSKYNRKEKTHNRPPINPNWKLYYIQTSNRHSVSKQNLRREKSLTGLTNAKRSILTIKQWMLVSRPCISCELVVFRVVSQSNFSLNLP